MTARRPVPSGMLNLDESGSAQLQDNLRSADDWSISWLAKVARDRGLVETPAPEALRSIFKLTAHHHFVEVAVDYEPRSLAVADGGAHIAVGTKAGAVVVVSFSQNGWKPQDLHAPFTPRPFETRWSEVQP